MWTCGIDIATQQPTPAIESSAVSAFGDKPERLRFAALSLQCAPRPCSAAGARRRSEKASGSIAASAEDADADVGLPPAGGVEEMLQRSAARSAPAR